MKRLLFLFLILSGCAVFTPLQRSSLIAVFHLIEANNYPEAKEVVEEMVKEEEESSQWSRTWYARGLLAHKAYADGKKNNDPRRFELYPNQLFVIWESFEKAMELDGRGRLERQIAPKYIILINNLKKEGEEHFKKREFDKALTKFQKAINVSQSPILTVDADNELYYNTALAAYEGKKMSKAIKYLEKLDKKNYSPNVSHLLFSIHLENEDIENAEKVLLDGISKYENNEALVLLMVDLLFEKGETQRSIEVLNEAIEENPEEPILFYTKGLVYQKSGEFRQAIDAYKKAAELEPENPMTYLNIATSFFNIGVEIEENTRTLESNYQVMEEMARSEQAFKSAERWLDKAYQIETRDQVVLLKLFELYRVMGNTDRSRSIQRRFNK